MPYTTNEMYWLDQRFEDMYYGLHGHLYMSEDPDCTICTDS